MIKFKIILLGDEGVGKTSLIKKYGGFVGPEYGKVIGVDFGHKRIEINNMLVWLQFCKVNQDPRFKYLRPLYYREAMAVLFLYDITRPETFEHLPNLITSVSEDTPKMIKFILIGNKADLEEHRAVEREIAEKFSKTYPNFVLFEEISIKTGRNIHKLFESLARLLLKL